ncbi:MAG: hypothetical protein FWJ59_06235 [Caldicoprobacter sp.]|uniref:hypothetical protein n=1 Tax=Caldicoprobacter sp. TaxID=2004500 RepID=UPI001DDBA231|nr:hypothetical protein [Clostridia bacterium]
MNKKYFAYGSCVNVESFKETMRDAKCEDRFRICGDEYLQVVLEGMKQHFPRKYINRYLIDHCNDEFETKR